MPVPTLQSLPQDFLLALRTTLHADLVTHLALAQTCRALRLLYEDDPIWKRACFLGGYGRPPRKYSEQNMSWREVATRIVGHRRRCAVRECVEAGNWFATLPSTRPTTATQMILHPLHTSLHLAPSVQAPDALAILATHLPSSYDILPFLSSMCSISTSSTLLGPLCAHMPASCAFATYPPVRRLALFCCGNKGKTDPVCVRVHNVDGCTLLDVNRALSAAFLTQPLLQPLLARTALAHYEGLMRCLPGHPRAHATLEAAEDLLLLLQQRRGGFLDEHEYPYLYALPEYIALGMEDGDVGC